MALQWMDDFTSYGTDAGRVARLLNGAYAEGSSASVIDLVADPDPSAGGVFVMKFAPNINSMLRKVLSGPKTTVGVLGRYWLTGLPVDATKRPRIAEFSDINNNVHCWVQVNPSGYFEAYRYDTAGDVLLGQSAAPQVTADSWRHIETKIVLHAAAGSIEVRQEGQTVLNIAGVRTTSDRAGSSADISNVRVRNSITGSATGAPTMYLKDFLIWDNGGAVNNNFFGTGRVYKCVPDGDVSLGWTPNSGVTGWNKINETTPDDDAGYISAPVPLPAASTFTLTDLPASVTAVKAVMAVSRSRKTDGGDGQLQTSLVSGASTGNGANRPITQAYTYFSDNFDLDPNGNINWTKAAVDALKLKLDRTV